jgi:hypothetical protein
MAAPVTLAADASATERAPISPRSPQTFAVVPAVGLKWPTISHSPAVTRPSNAWPGPGPDRPPSACWYYPHPPRLEGQPVGHQSAAELGRQEGGTDQEADECQQIGPGEKGAGHHLGEDQGSPRPRRTEPNS